MFKEASQLKLRFSTSVGNLSTEDLWDLPLTSRNGASLDNLAKELNREIKNAEEESFVVKKSSSNKVLDLKFSIVKDVIKDKMDAAEKARTRAEIKAKKDKIMEAIAKKEDESLDNAELDELRSMLAEMENA